LRAAVTEKSANPNRLAPSARPEFEAGRPPEDEVPDQKAIDPEKYHADVVGLSIQFEKRHRQRPQLFHLKYAQVRPASQDDQGADGLSSFWKESKGSKISPIWFCILG
jgi:hypothetical protein